MRYDYLTNETEDIIEYFNANYDFEELRNLIKEDEDAFKEQLEDKLWVEDSVTGNGSGSYTFSRDKAAEYLAYNVDLVMEALTELGYDKISEIADKDVEWFDVLVRCYLLSQAIDNAIEKVEKQWD